MVNTDDPRDPHSLTPEPEETLTFDDSEPICIRTRDSCLPAGAVIEITGFEPGDKTLTAAYAYQVLAAEVGFGNLEKDDLIYMGCTDGRFVADTEPLHTPVEVCIAAWQYHTAVCQATSVSRIHNHNHGPFPFGVYINHPESNIYFQGHPYKRYKDMSVYPSFKQHPGEPKTIMTNCRTLRHTIDPVTGGPTPPSPSI